MYVCVSIYSDLSCTSLPFLYIFIFFIDKGLSYFLLNILLGTYIVLIFYLVIAGV